MNELIYVVSIIKRNDDGKILVIKTEDNLEFPSWIYNFRENPSDFLKRKINESLRGSFVVRSYVGESYQNLQNKGKDKKINHEREIIRNIAYRVDCLSSDVSFKEYIFSGELCWLECTSLNGLKEEHKEILDSSELEFRLIKSD
jgi:hypothetical protein